MTRTTSELQLYEEEKAAEYRDYCMFVRIMNGMSGKESTINSREINVIQTKEITYNEESPRIIKNSSMLPMVRSTAVKNEIGENDVESDAESYSEDDAYSEEAIFD
eukprot:CAMPEP_0178934924 /NCGR_PEP_ID=MMETSP0786-20121207/24192_1 /TAXON_ID=186022 /ORGANISM="Thalassionema frauenfeldii, Strain CCMP 1798" /LENGTH=105 /DNA_ID=CAMNT_0020612879 /DNA_START=237 /DNA_END=551 /DNA_ORIENTATION=+